MNAGIRVRERKEKNLVICIERICLSEKKQSIPLQSSRKETKIECTHPKF